MEKKAEKIHPDQWLKDLPVQKENPAFQAEEMIDCRECRRKNPPTRLDCLYCGAELELSEARSEFLKLNLRKLESWEKGFNLVYLSGLESSDETKFSEIAEILKCEKDFLHKLACAAKFLPLVRAESEREAETLQKKLRRFSVDATIIADEKLAIEKPSLRLRGVEFFADQIALILFNRDEVVRISNDDLLLIVSGAIFERKVRAIEKRDKKAGNKLLESSETASDEFLIDIYSRENELGYRVFARGFDFSCLEAEKGILGAENLKKLVRKLQQIATKAKFVDDYLNLRESLSNVWQVEETGDSLGLKRDGFGKYNLENITTIDNLSQFTKYSRLQRHLL